MYFIRGRGGTGMVSGLGYARCIQTKLRCADATTLEADAVFHATQPALLGGGVHGYPPHDAIRIAVEARECIRQPASCGPATAKSPMRPWPLHRMADPRLCQCGG